MLPRDMGVHRTRRVSDVPPVPPRRIQNRHFPFQSSKRRRSGSVPERQVSCVLVGDGAVGKTSLVVSYTTNGFPAEYIPTAFDNFAAKVVVDGKPVRLQLCDMAGQKWGLEDGIMNHEALSRLRPLCYRGADVFVLCYSVVRPSSLRSAVHRWAPQIRLLCPGAPLLLVGTQLDLREDVQVLIQLAQAGEGPVSPGEGRRRAREVGAVAFLECSALTQKNLKDVFDVAITASLQEREGGGPAVVQDHNHNQDQNQQNQQTSLREKTPEKMRRSVGAGWWRKISCLVTGGGEGVK